MALLDPSTNQPLPADAIQRVLFIANTLHVYNIPPLTSIKGHSATSWTADPARHIFTARLRVVETSSSSSFSPSSPEGEAPSAGADADTATDNLKVDIVLEDPSSGQLFAAAPYTDPAVVEPVLDSSRFFALTVRDPEGRKATLGIGFEERSEAFDLAVVLQEARRVLGMEPRAGIGGEAKKGEDRASVEDKDYSLKEGETITVKIGKNMGRRKGQGQGQGQAETEGENDDADGQANENSKPLQSFALPPPPPPSSTAGDVKRKRRSLAQLGFDDGQFGEFS
ncbi:hypothetical protein E4U55_006460 [Claviceps digitariae]|nr:hypothetical protein E4U55_006460 [Claviceps digitariae]